MEYKVLGPLEVWDGPQLIELGSHKQRAVLALLLIDAGHVVSTDQLIDRLWGDEAPASAVGTLQGYISNLRKALEPERRPGQPSGLLASQSPGYVLQIQREELDSWVFEGLIRDANKALREGRYESAKSLLEDALALWRGSPFADFGFEPFAEQEIGRLEELHLTAVEDRMEAVLALGGHREVVGELRRLVEANPLRERLRGLLARALYRDARQAEALDVLRQGRERLADELGIDPGPDLRQLEDDILRQDPGLDWKAPPKSVPAFAEDLVGRKTELERLTAAADSARSGRGRVVIVAGDPGIGKTRLAEEFAASSEGFTVLWGRCYEGEGAPPLWAWRQLLKDLATKRPHVELVEAAGGEAAHLRSLLPDVFSSVPAPAQSADPEEARFRLYVAVTTMLQGIADEHPLGLVLDDIHWADPATLHLLRFLAADISQRRIVVIATYRDTDVGRSDPLAATLASVARLPGVERVTLQGLEVGAVSDYIESALGTPSSGDLAVLLHDRTGGNPFFLSEIVRLVQGQGDLREIDVDLATTSIPANVRDVVLRRVQSLPEETEQLLGWGAVAGRTFELELVARSVGLDPEKVLQALRPAFAARLLESEGGGTFRFSHALISDAIYDDMNPGVKAPLHLRTAEALEPMAAADGSWAAQVASHFFRAAVLGVADKAIDYAIRGSDYMVEHMAYEQAQELLIRALEAAPSLPSGSGRIRRELAIHVRRSNLLMMTKGYAAPDVAPALIRSIELSRDLGDTRELVASLWKYVALHNVRSDLRTAASASDDLLRVAEETDEASYLWLAHHARGIIAWHRGELHDSRRHLEMALRYAPSVHAGFAGEVIPEEDPVLSSSGFLALTLWLLGDEQAQTVSEDQLRRARERERPFPLAFALLHGMLMAASADDLPTVVEYSEEGVAISEKHGFRLMQTLESTYRAWAVAKMQDGQAAIEDLVGSRSAFEETGARMLKGHYAALLADIHLLGGRPDEALAVIESGLEHSETTGESLFVSELHRLKGLALLELDRARTEEAGAALSKALAVAREQGARVLEERAAKALRRFRRDMTDARV